MKSAIYTNDICGFFPVYPLTIGINHLQEAVSRPHGLKIHQIFIVTDGTGVLSSKGKTFRLQKGDMFLIEKDVPHSYKSEGQKFMTSFLGFEGYGCDSVFKYFGVENCKVYRGRENSVVLSLVNEFYSCFDTINNISSASARTYNILIAFFSEAYRKMRNPIETVYDYLCLNYKSVVTLDDILRIYPHSKSKLFKDFPAEYGMTVVEMLNLIRLRHACSLLENFPDMPLKTVSLECGFNSESYFCKLFRREYGKSPRQKF